VNTFVGMYDAPLGARNGALSQRVLDDMLGASYDTFPWFRFTALGVFASVTNGNLVSNVALKERIAIRRYENLSEAFRGQLGPGGTRPLLAGSLSWVSAPRKSRQIVVCVHPAA
jgi:hypothetical protein